MAASQFEESLLCTKIMATIAECSLFSYCLRSQARSGVGAKTTDACSGWKDDPRQGVRKLILEGLGLATNRYSESRLFS